MAFHPKTYRLLKPGGATGRPASASAAGNHGANAARSVRASRIGKGYQHGIKLTACSLA
jgi:hypothetical protein